MAITKIFPLRTHLKFDDTARRNIISKDLEESNKLFKIIKTIQTYRLKRNIHNKDIPTETFIYPKYYSKPLFYDSLFFFAVMQAHFKPFNPYPILVNFSEIVYLSLLSNRSITFGMDIN